METMVVKTGEAVALAVGCFSGGLFCGLALCMAGKLTDKHPELDETHASTRYAMQHREGNNA